MERIGALGYVLSSPSDVMLTTLSSMEHEITSLYDGAAAEEVFFGKEDLSVGSSNDFEKATQLLDTIVNKLSMHSVSKLNYRMLKVESENGLKMMEEHSARLYERHCGLLRFTGRRSIN